MIAVRAIALASLSAAALSACVPLSGRQRLAQSSISCARAAVSRAVPEGIPDKRAHCLATASIARNCSAAEAYGAGIAKELMDLFSAGDAEWGDLRADAAGVRCARTASGEPDVDACCRAAAQRLRRDRTH